jgi:spore coat protein CotH
MRPLRDRCRIASVALAVAAALTTLTTAQQVTTPTLPSDPLFDDSRVERLDLRMNSSDWAKLKADFRLDDRYPVDVVYRGETVRFAAAKSRGLGSRNERNPGLLIDLNYYTDGQTFLELTKFVLDNLVQDHSGVKETVTMKLFARLNIPAPREALVRLYMNNQFAGVYGIVEAIDKRFLARIYGIIAEDTQNDGYLYDFNYVDAWYFTDLGRDFLPYRLRFEPETKKDKSDQEKFGQIEELVRRVNESQPGRLMADVGGRLDLPAFMRYVAAQNFVAQPDGFLGYAGMNNFYFYRLEGSSSHVFIAWDEDNAFSQSDFPIMVRHDENVLMQKAMQVPELRAEYYAGLAAALASATEPTGPDNRPWLEYEMRRQLDLIAQHIREDELKPYSLTDHENERARLLQFAQDRPRIVRELLNAAQSLRVQPR